MIIRCMQLVSIMLIFVACTSDVPKVAWNELMSNENTIEETEMKPLEIEAYGTQFEWLIRYAGRDQELGETSIEYIDLKNGNIRGQDLTDPNTIDDYAAEVLYLPVGRKIRFRIQSRDVLHSFYIPHFRLKMEAVPGMPTHIDCTAMVTTDSMRLKLSKDVKWQELDGNGQAKFETFDYRLSCVEICGRGHYQMQRIIKVVSQEEYENWQDQQEGIYPVEVSWDGWEVPTFEVGDSLTSNLTYTALVPKGQYAKNPEFIKLKKLILERSKVKALYDFLITRAKDSEQRQIIKKNFARFLKIARTTTDLNHSIENTQTAQQKALELLE